jgi:uncharacterized protein YjdB
MLGDTLTLGTGRYDDSDTRPCAETQLAQLKWTSTDATVLRIDSTGFVRAVAPGSATIAVTDGNLESELDYAVIPAFADLKVFPSNPTLRIGDTLTMVAYFQDSTGNTVTDEPVKWLVPGPKLALALVRALDSPSKVAVQPQVTVQALDTGRAMVFARTHRRSHHAIITIQPR